MSFFRSEEQVLEWCANHGHSVSAVLTLDKLWQLASVWYSDRLKRDFRRPSPDEIAEIFSRLGLRGDFWRLG